MKNYIRFLKTNIIIIILCLVAIILFYNFFFDFQIDKKEIISLLLKNKKELDFFIQNNFIELSFLFFIFSIIWTILLGFGIPIMIIAAYLFDPLNATLILAISKTIGVSIIFILYNKFFGENLIKKFKFETINKKKIIKLLKKNELYYLILLRLFPFIPPQVIDIFPLLIKVKFYNYVISKFIGSLLPLYLFINLFSKIYKDFEQNLVSSFDLSVTKELLLAFIIFGLFIIISNLVKKKIFRF